MGQVAPRGEDPDALRAAPADGSGVTGVALEEDDPPVDEWVVVLLGADPVVFAATDLRIPDCDDDDRCCSYGVSRDAELVDACARLLGI